MDDPQTPTKPKKYSKLTVMQSAEAVALLKQHFRPADHAYAEGWSDDKIAAAVGANPLANSVKVIRQKNFGHLRPPAAPADKSPGVLALEERVHKLELFAQHICNEMGIALFDFTGEN